MRSAFGWKPGTGGATALGTDIFNPANLLNQLTQVTLSGTAARSVTWDAAGNMISDGVLTYVHDAENRLTSVARTTPSLTAAYTYDPLGRRVQRNVNATSTLTLHDGDEEIAEYDATGALIRRFIPGPGTDEPIAVVVPASGGGAPERRFFHEDRIGNVIAMSGLASGGSAPALAEGPFTYDSYGRSPQPLGTSATSTPFRYTGRRLDTETGNYYYRARFYTPTLGQFIETDPVGYADSLNLYAYVGGDPLNKLDPSGMCTGSRIENDDGTCAISGGWTTQGFAVESSSVDERRVGFRRFPSAKQIGSGDKPKFANFFGPDSVATQEFTGGHTIKMHVGKSIDFLELRLMQSPKLSAVSTFTSYMEAELWYQEAMDDPEVREGMERAFAAGLQRYRFFVHHKDLPAVGLVLHRDSGRLFPGNGVLFVVDPRPLGHQLVTSFPVLRFLPFNFYLGG